MQDYLKNIVKRVQAYSKDLDTIEIFVDKKWMLIDESGRQHQYTFMRDKRLLMSLDGMTKTGSWELLPTKQLLINRMSDAILLDKFFIQNALLVMKLSGSDDEPFVLINKDEIPDLDVPKYLEKFEVEKNRSIGGNLDGFYVQSNGELNGSHFFQGMMIILKKGILLDGVYKTSRGWVGTSEYVELKSNIVKRHYYLVQYKYNDLDISIEQKSLPSPQVGDKVLLGAGLFPPFGARFDILSTDNNNYISISIENDGTIKYVDIKWSTVEIISVLLIITVILFVLIVAIFNKL